ncbi:TPA: exodeoxyribonuclease V subunit beta [Vibrio vulnificus]|uniref:RecBCD enzyme subunit RecB n=1 Tax=Vibrio vulnificus TaxID=672 RepID=A0A8H9K5C8_VIBVL|nr:exodeoxyribonuclease V subunit beta [Vibrio vulnificus]
MEEQQVETRQIEAEKLNPLTFPLFNNRLIEASAGTGKTFTIATLYLRLLLGHGDNNSRYKERLSVEQILVVTFTEAATEELRDRIRRRINETRFSFLKGYSNDPLIQQIMDETPDHKEASEILLQAERQMDEAAVYTIHGFCQRMLTQNAFESGSMFDNDFLTDESLIRNRVVSDFWRKTFYDKSPEISLLVRDIWDSPSSLLKDINSHLSGNPVYIKSKIQDVDDLGIEEIHQQNIDSIKSIKSLIQSCSKSEIESIIFQSGVNKRSYTKKSTPKWIDEVFAWAHEETINYAVSDKLTKFSTSALSEKTTQGGLVPDHPLFHHIEEFLASPPDLKGPLTSKAVNECRNLLQAAKDKMQVLSFDDLLVKLSASLSRKYGKVLASRIREQYPVAMIDEFQDTDPLQFNIFNRIYGVRFLPEEKINDYGLFIIGDPKQAIYAFRGADIFTYIGARREVKNHYTLDTNWRSSQSMVTAVNKVFSNCESPFIFDSDIQFLQVNASPSAHLKKWHLDGIEQPALSFWLSEHKSPSSKESYLKEMSKATAAKIHELLTKSHQGKATLASGDGDKPITAGDIAILVRTSSEAQLVRDELAQLDIPSVYLSNRDSVFSSHEAHDVLRLLIAVNQPEDDHKLRSAIATHLLGLTSQQLVDIEADEYLWEQTSVEFHEYKKTWERKGVLAMLRNLIVKRSLAENLLSNTGGDRRLTNIQHIGELLQAQSQKIDSQHGLIRWLTEHIEEPNGNIDDEQLRLESDSNLVQIVTIHKSKGLEYDFVFLPFLCSFRPSQSYLYHDETTNKAILDTTNSQFALNRSEKERLAEDLRLAYVALTRAVYGCFVGMTPIRDGRKTKDPSGLPKSAIGWLIGNGEQISTDKLPNLLENLNENSVIDVVEPPETPESGYVHPLEEQVEYKARDFHGSMLTNWYVTSYSNLANGSHRHHDNDLLDVDIDGAIGNNSDVSEVEQERNIFNFYKGAQPGTFLHTIFENIDFAKDPSHEETKTEIERLLKIEGYEEEWLPILQDMVRNVLTRPLNGTGIRLCDVPEQYRLPEMEFMFPISDLKAHKVSEIIGKHDPLSKDLAPLNFYDVSGMLKGFIDLTFFGPDGKFYVLDWKSNWLGENEASYTQEAMMLSMQDHRYDFQYQLYSLALHRFLKYKLCDYDYDKHFGGVYYVYLRGVMPDGDNGVFFTRPSKEFLLELETITGQDQS